LTKERKRSAASTLGGQPQVRESPHPQNEWLEVRKSTTNVVAPAAQAWRNRNVQRFPGQRGTPKWARRPQPATQLQHSDRKSKIHVVSLCGGSSLTRLLFGTAGRKLVHNFLQLAAQLLEQLRDYFARRNSTMVC
jgi:hypothetical protein